MCSVPQRAALSAVRHPVAREVGAMLLALMLAPLAAVALNSIIVFLLMGPLRVVNTPLAPPGVRFVAEAFSRISRDLWTTSTHAYAVAWLTVFPPFLILRTRGWLRLWSAMLSALILSLATVSTMTLLLDSATSATTEQMLAVFVLLAGTTIPAAMATAAAAWMRRADDLTVGVKAPSRPECVPRETPRIRPASNPPRTRVSGLLTPSA